MKLKNNFLFEIICLIVLLCLTYDSHAASYHIKNDVRHKKSITPPQSAEFIKLKKQLSKSSIAKPLNVHELFDNAVFEHPEDPFDELRS